jgi:hypothetical protein
MQGTGVGATTVKKRVWLVPCCEPLLLFTAGQQRAVCIYKEAAIRSRCHRALLHLTLQLALKQERHPFARACRQRRRRPPSDLVRPPPDGRLH